MLKKDLELKVRDLEIEKKLLASQLETWERWAELGIIDYLPVFAKKMFGKTSKETTRLLDKMFGKKDKRKK